MGLWQSDEDFPIAGGRSVPAPRDERSDAAREAYHAVQAAARAEAKQSLADDYHRMFVEGDREGLARAYAYAYASGDSEAEKQLGACLKQLGARAGCGGWVW